MDTLIVYTLLALFIAAALFAFFGAPRFINDWACRQTWDQEAAIKALIKHRSKGTITNERFDELMLETERIFADTFKRVNLRISLEKKKAQVARRRPIQRKLGRI